MLVFKHTTNILFTIYSMISDYSVLCVYKRQRGIGRHLRKVFRDEWSKRTMKQVRWTIFSLKNFYTSCCLYSLYTYDDVMMSVF